MNNIVWHHHKVTKAERAELKSHKPAVLWFTGLSGSGKSTVAGCLEELLHHNGVHTYLLDGDNIRHGLCGDLGFSDKDRVENIRRIGEVAKLFVDAGVMVLTAFISPFRADRQMVRQLLEVGEFIEVFVDTPLDVCEQRDPKGLYKKARKGDIPNFTGIDSEYETPEQAEVIVKTAQLSVEECAQQLLSYLESEGYLPAKR
ncbi:MULTISPECIES: adenylyl-sulfate kinase [Corallincola]|uniref:Adenylyl-sulfate kinase n=3 Tax=Corallincola TaxID=1775176 RepID=A0A368NFL3_9GAMM|nr:MULTISPECIES: adenylyl-sulfate kinase [Corallincola]RCU49427.1 adenylyl-sulfate kinase [Corallincola holothuriorum]TAA47715.1 adenylyl-sulfate kinase [Corallincola spongiicola]TCI01531.1 adenylyl-sulfate kinase [Corallincola luteus]